MALGATVLAKGPLGASPEARPAVVKATKADAAVARTLCATCHALPAPDVLPRASWRGSITKMSLIRENKDVPGWGQGVAGAARLPDDMEAAVRYYEESAPLALPSLEAWPPVETGGSLRFARHPLKYPGALSPEPAVANVRFADLEGDARLEVVISDMRQGVVLLGHPYEPDRALKVLAEIPNPDHAEVVDLDGDGVKDLLVADLGGFLPSDHDKGQAVWLRGVETGGFTTYAMGGFPRVADVEAADFYGDGRLDLLVAGFGWRHTGGITLLRNRTVNYRQPSFERVKLDERPGAIHVVPVDLNRDGRMDFVALISQEHESVEAFINEGGGKFRRQVLYRAPHPNWGSSGLSVVDFDKDGDMDVLVTNGDMFDDDILKPYHGIRWLENQGGLRFVEHPLARLAGVHRALAVDLDGDGDLDVVASAFTPGASSSDPKLPSLVWLEQTKPGQFKRHTLETGHLTHATLDAADYDGDGDIDLVVGNFLEGKPADTWAEVWENLRTGPKGQPR
jgi:FG-GAP-like repeat